MTITSVCIIEDEKPLADMLEVHLSKHFTVHVAHNGKEGLEKVLANKPECILLDLMMPVMDGIAFLELLRQDPYGKDVLVIVLTNFAASEKLEDVKKYGVTDVLVKSNWSIHELSNEILKRVYEHVS